jgi:hypothetical protein
MVQVVSTIHARCQEVSHHPDKDIPQRALRANETVGKETQAAATDHDIHDGALLLSMLTMAATTTTIPAVDLYHGFEIASPEVQAQTIAVETRSLSLLLE